MPVLLPLAQGAMEFSLYGVDGIDHTLDYGLTGYMVLVGPSGRFNAERDILTTAVPLREGAFVRRVNVGMHAMTIPLHVTGDTVDQIYDRVEALSRWLETSETTPAWFRARRPSGDWREIAVQYRSGLEADENWRAATIHASGHMNVVLDLVAPDPAWYDLADTEPDPYTVDSPAAGWPYNWPIVLASSTVLAVAGVNNTGDLPAYPVWTVTGPGSDLAITNLTTGEVIRVTRTLLAGQQIVIDTRPRYLRPSEWQLYDPAGANLFTAGSGALWTLPPGISTVQVALAGATAETSVELRYRRRFRGP